MELKTLRRFLGREIGPAIVAAVEAIPDGCEIVTFKAGENLPILCAFIPENFYEGGSGFIPEYVWTGETWEEVGFL